MGSLNDHCKSCYTKKTYSIKFHQVQYGHENKVEIYSCYVFSLFFLYKLLNVKNCGCEPVWLGGFRNAIWSFHQWAAVSSYSCTADPESSATPNWLTGTTSPIVPSWPVLSHFLVCAPASAVIDWEEVIQIDLYWFSQVMETFCLMRMPWRRRRREFLELWLQGEIPTTQTTSSLRYI